MVVYQEVILSRLSIVPALWPTLVFVQSLALANAAFGFYAVI